MFQRGDVQPARQLVKLDFDEHRLYDSLKEKRWDRVQFFTEGELSPLLPLVHRLRIDKFNAAHTTQAAEIAFQQPAGRIASDTGQLLWEAELPFAGVATPSTYMIDGRQYVVVASSGGRDPKGPVGGSYIAFALPR